LSVLFCHHSQIIPAAEILDIHKNLRFKDYLSR
jgi:hypothetical protein